MALKDIAGRLEEAARAADAVMADYLSEPLAGPAGLEKTIREYIAVKLRLDGDEVSDNITVMVRISVSKDSGIPLEKLKAMDRPGACGSAPTVLAKRVLLFLDVQKKLGVAMKPELAQDIQTVQDLAGVLYPLLEEKSRKRENR